MSSPKILIIEDSPDIVETVSLALEIRWPDVKIISAGRGEEGIQMVESHSPDLVILDLGLPDISGFEVLKRMRLFSSIPVLILTVRSNEADIVKALEWGAEDYMIKPFKHMELLARIQGILRRSAHRSEDPLVCGQLRFDPVSQRLTAGDKEVRISRTEGLILARLMRNAGMAVSYAGLAEAMWGDDYPEASDSIKVHIRHLREKLEEDPSHPKLIVTKPGTGYMLVK